MKKWIIFLRSDNSSYFGEVLHALAFTEFLYSFENTDCSLRGNEIGCAYLNGAGSCHNELQSVASAANASEANDGHFHGFGNLPDHPDGHRTHRRPGKSSGYR